MNTARFWTLLGLMLAAAASRIVPHPPNFAPMTALAVFGGATLARRGFAVAATVGTLFLSDLLLQATHLAGWQPAAGFYSGQWAVYGCTIATVGLGRWIRKGATVPAIALATLAGAILFFLVTNLVFVYGSDSMYPHSLRGVITSYEMALPFFRNSLIGGAFYAGVLFGTLGLVENRWPATRVSSASEPAR
jgi:hypothetical protein